MEPGAPLGGEHRWERWGTEAEVRLWCRLHWGAGSLLVACLDTKLAGLGESMTSQSPGSWQAPRSCCSPPLPCRLWADGLGPRLHPWGTHHTPLSRLPPAVPHPRSRQRRPVPAHTLVLPTLHLRAGCAGKPLILQPLPLPSPVTPPATF